MDQHEPGGVPGPGFPEEGGRVGEYACGKGFPNSGSEMNESSAIAQNGRKGECHEKHKQNVQSVTWGGILLVVFALVGHVEAAGTWSLTGSMSTARYVHTATLLPDGRVLVSGGANGSAYLASAEIFSPYDQPQNKDECKKNGWQGLTRADGTPFKNQGDCIQYVNTGK